MISSGMWRLWLFSNRNGNLNPGTPYSFLLLLGLSPGTTPHLLSDPKYRFSRLIDYRAELWPHGKLINIGAYGGTAEASMSTLGVGKAADCNNDGAVNAGDLFLIAEIWLRQQVLLAEDINRDNVVDLLDLAGLGRNWHWRE